MSRVSSILFLLFLITTSSLSQVGYRGTPYIKNFSKSDYSAGTQNWGICQDQRGFMFFANNDGLLSYNGVEWKLTRVSSNSPPRSIFIDSENRIFIGLINDFGIISMDTNKEPSFQSLKDLLPEEYKEFDDIWRIHETGSGIVFQCQKYIFIYSDDNIKVIEPLNRFHFSHKLGSRILVQELGVGVHELEGDKLVKLSWWQDKSDIEISTILELDENTTLVGTSYDGVYILKNGQISKWDVPVNSLLTNSSLYAATELPNGSLAFGTILDGLIICDKDGNTIYSLNIDRGIQNNTVLSLFVDKSDNLWMGLDNGIDFLEINSPLSYLGSNKIGTGYTCRVFNGNLYLGTNQGLYVKPFDNSTASTDFVLVENTAGQVWTLEEFGGQLFCGHNSGTYLVEANRASRICSEEGAWKFIPLKGYPDLVLGGHYKGLVLYKRINNRWEFYKRIEGFDESSRYLFQDSDNNIWVGHSGRGLYKIRISASEGTLLDVVKYDAEYGLPSNDGNIPFIYNDNVFVSTINGVYEYQKLSNSFISSEKLNSIFQNSGRIKTLVNGVNNDVWYIADNESGLLTEGPKSTISSGTVPLRKLTSKFVNEFEFIYPCNNENIFLGLEEGFAHFSPLHTIVYDESFSSFITKIVAPYIDSTFYLRTSESVLEYNFPFAKNLFRFYFAAPFYENEILLEFSYFLEGFSEEWSLWSTDTYRDFSNLHEGTYILKLKSRNVFGVEGDLGSVSFEILPPWHRSILAYLIYLLCIVVFIFSIIRYILYRIKLSENKQEEKHQQDIKEREERYHREALITENEIIDLRNEKLRSEMTFRDKELANQTMAIIDKNKFLIRVKEDLTSVQDYVVAEKAKNKIHSLIRRIKKEIDIKHHNKIFETYFDEANEEFFRHLKQKHPDLTPYDLRLCAFIRMNISTKEIATILNISYRGAEVSRYRLRKKMDLSRDVNLSSYLTAF